jgi:hypothetical protein
VPLTREANSAAPSREPSSRRRRSPRAVKPERSRMRMEPRMSWYWGRMEGRWRRRRRSTSASLASPILRVAFVCVCY